MPHRRHVEKWKISKANRKAAAKNGNKHLSNPASRATPRAKSNKSASKPPCHFLRIPLVLKIRHKIYGYLLLNPPRASLHPRDTQEWEDIDSDGPAYDSSGYDSSDFEDQMFALSNFNPYGIEMGDMCDGMFNEVYNGMYSGGGITNFGYDMFDDFDDQSQSDAFGFGSQGSSFSISIDDGERNDNEGGRGIRFLGKPLPTKVSDEKEKDIKRHLAILRTNRQIYNEASALLHSDLTIVVQPGDTLTDTPGNAIVKRSEKLWRHAPSNRLPSTKFNGQTVYTTPSLDGVLEPHVFAQFEKISFFGDFEFYLDRDAPSLHINDDLRASAKDERMFASYLTAVKNITRWCENPLPTGRADNGLRETLQDVADITISRVVITQPSVADVVQKFVDLLSVSPVIRHLEFILDVEVECSNDSKSIDYDYLDSEHKAKLDEKCCVADERATELVLEAGILDPLRNLSNVMNFSLVIETLGRGNDFMKPSKKHLKIIQDLKNTIERNWVVKHSSH